MHFSLLLEKYKMQHSALIDIEFKLDADRFYLLTITFGVRFATNNSICIFFRRNKGSM